MRLAYTNLKPPKAPLYSKTMFDPPPSDTITITDTHLASIPDLARLQISGLSIIHNKMKSLDNIRFPPTLTYLSIRRNNLQPDGWPSFPLHNLQTLIADNNNIRYMPDDFATIFPSLENLSLSDNNIQDTDFLRHCTNLKKLCLDSNNIMTLNHLPPNLEELSVNDCVIHIIQSRLPSTLQKLQLSGNRLKFAGMPFHWGTSLRSLDLSKNEIKRFPRKLPDTLESLSIQNNGIDVLPDTLPESLRFLNITRNNIRTLPNYVRNKPIQCFLISNNQLISYTKPDWTIVFYAEHNWNTTIHHMSQKKIKKLWRYINLMKRLRNYSRCYRIRHELIEVAMQPSRCFQVDAISSSWLT